MRVDITRRGGVAGVALRGAIDTATLPSPTREAVEAALSELRYGAAPGEPRHPDGFRYDITVDDGVRRRSARLDEAEMPPDLASAISEVLQLP